MGLLDAIGLTVIIRFFWPLLLAFGVLMMIFRMAGNVAARSAIENDAYQQKRLLFVRRVFWTGIVIVVLCSIVYFSPEIEEAYRRVMEALRK